MCFFLLLPTYNISQVDAYRFLDAFILLPFASGTTRCFPSLLGLVCSLRSMRRVIAAFVRPLKAGILYYYAGWQHFFLILIPLSISHTRILTH
ncbi:hypothetical protein DEU56DRAFT_120419 [Suillus clintonianus]|uniref:uncharacterized protein n=1 Tax=Suillus clintonianus TaxID=1904413 RepID=UPI001B8805F2|nr:uncharacterized protein DEU56DRAFT_120419 [Suillus clintonianus]KAG2119445.1 hypothetical protein DEU56DRAFT_120419 [Suillus clintonianus]